MFLFFSGKGSRLHSLKADLLNGLVEDADRLFLQDHRVLFACHIQCKSIALAAGTKQLLCGHKGDLQRNRCGQCAAVNAGRNIAVPAQGLGLPLRVALLYGDGDYDKRLLFLL